MPQYQLSTYDRETGEIETQSSKYGSGFSPTLSPDGKWLVYGSRYNDQTGLIARNLSDGEEYEDERMLSTRYAPQHIEHYRNISMNEINEILELNKSNF